MKKMILLAAVLMFLSGCSTYYGNYDYNAYFQNDEPFITVDNEQEAADFIARKLKRYFKRSGMATMAVLNFTDEYGDRLNRGIFFADRVVAALSRYRNPVVVERESLYEIVRERELSQTSLIINKGYELRQLVQADYILHGRIYRGDWDDMVSVRCFEVGSGRVIYAATIDIDRTPDFIPQPHYGPYPGPHPEPRPPRPPKPGPVIIIEPNEPEEETPVKPKDKIENVGKKDPGNAKPSTSDQYQYKKKDEDPPKKEEPVVEIKEDGLKKDPVIKKNEEKEPVQEINKPDTKKKSPDPVTPPTLQEPVKPAPAPVLKKTEEKKSEEESKEDETKKTTTTSTLKTKESVLKK